jgi:hypothetical protein
MSWKEMPLSGADSIARVCGERARVELNGTLDVGDGQREAFETKRDGHTPQ